MRWNMKAERARNGMTADEVAAAIGVHTNSVYAWERGEAEPKATHLIKLGQLYGCTPDYLMGFTSDREAKAIATL